MNVTMDAEVKRARADSQATLTDDEPPHPEPPPPASAEPPLLFFREHGADGWLSNFAPTPFTGADGTVFPTMEHYFHHAKAVEFNDLDKAAKILAAATPLQAKRLGRTVVRYNDVVWAARSRVVVLEGLRLKVEQHPEIKAKLLATGSRRLAEANPRDGRWGIGMGKARGLKEPWRGTNWLGEAWVEVRGELTP